MVCTTRLANWALSFSIDEMVMHGITNKIGVSRDIHFFEYPSPIGLTVVMLRWQNRMSFSPRRRNDMVTGDENPDHAGLSVWVAGFEEREPVRWYPSPAPH